MDKSKQLETPMQKSENDDNFWTWRWSTIAKIHGIFLRYQNYGVKGCDFRKLFKMWVP